MELTNSTRALSTASYVAVELTPEETADLEHQPARGLEKLNFIRQVGLSAEHVWHTREALLSDSVRELGSSAHLQTALVHLEDIATSIASSERGGSNA